MEAIDYGPLPDETATRRALSTIKGARRLTTTPARNVTAGVAPRASASRYRGGWSDDLGVASWDAADAAWDAAEALIAELAEADPPRDAYAKRMTYSQVSGGFWSNAPKELTWDYFPGLERKDSRYVYLSLADESELEGKPDPVYRRDDGTWEVVWLPRPNDSAGFSGGWRSFSIDLQLWPLDVCVFVVPGKEKKKEEEEEEGEREGRNGELYPTQLEVHIFRAFDYDDGAGGEVGSAEAQARAKALPAREREQQREELRAAREAAKAAKSAAAQGEEADQDTDKEEEEKEMEAALEEEAVLAELEPTEEIEQDLEDEDVEIVDEEANSAGAKGSGTPELPPATPAALNAAGAGPSKNSPRGGSEQLQELPRTRRSPRGGAATAPTTRKRRSATATPTEDDGTAAAPQTKRIKRSTKKSKKSSAQKKKNASKKAKEEEEEAEEVDPRIAGVTEDGEEQYWVRRIEGFKFDEETGDPLYYIRWWGYDSDDNTWEPAECLDAAPETYPRARGVVFE